MAEMIAATGTMDAREAALMQLVVAHVLAVTEVLRARSPCSIVHIALKVNKLA